MFDVSTTEVRRYFANVWKKRLNTVLDPLEKKALSIILAHPEYHHYLDNIENYLDQNWQPKDGETNPFLHLSLHLSIQEQVAINQPPDIKEIHENLCKKTGNWVEAEHLMMDALVEMIWQAQKYGTGFDVNLYITQLRKLVGLGQEDNPRLNPHQIK